MKARSPDPSGLDRVSASAAVPSAKVAAKLGVPTSASCNLSGVFAQPSGGGEGGVQGRVVWVGFHMSRAKMNALLSRN